MTRKDYELIAQVFKHFADADKAAEKAALTSGDIAPEFKQSDTDRARISRLALVAHQLAAAMYCQNAKFDRAIFIKACGL